MESLLTNSGIDSVTHHDKEGGQYYFAFTKNLLQRHIYVEYYQYENEEGDPAEFEYESSVNLYALQGTATLNCTLFFDDRPLVAPQIILGVIDGAIKMIERTQDNELLAVLRQLSISALSSENIYGFEQLDNQDQVVREKIKLIDSLIEGRQARRN